MSLELQMPAGVLQAALQRSRDLVAFALQAADHAKPVDLQIPGTFGQVNPARNRALDIEAARAEFRSWVLGNGLRDCVEAIGGTLEWARRFCFVWTRAGSVKPIEDGKFRLNMQFTGEEWNTIIIRGGAKFDRFPLPQKLEHLEETYGWQRPELSDRILSLNAVRNCLTHRDGIVGAADLKQSTDQGLSLRWRTLQPVARTGDEKRVLVAGSQVSQGDEVGIEYTDKEKVFRAGERVTISATEYTEISLTFLLFAQQIEASTVEVQNRRVAASQSQPPAAP
ncbi:MAG: hypothetical protein ACR2IF_05255 [Terriglobales bacterium]